MAGVEHTPMAAHHPHLDVTSASKAAFRIVAVFLVICGLLLPRTAQAGKHHWHPNAYHIITAVNETTQVVTIGTENSKDHSEKSLKINGFTDITVDGLKATLRDLKPGMMVQVNEDTDNVAKAIDAQHHNKK